MQVKLVATSKPEIEGLKSAEDLIVYCARVSNPSNQMNVETGDRLLAYCIRNHHWSVFEQADMTVEIKTSRAIAAQILRHKSFFFQEFSQRYSVVTELEPFELRMQGKTNRQVGEDLFVGNREASAKDVQDLIKTTQDKQVELYNSLIEAGVAKESARFVLPLNTQTTLYMKGSIRSWIHYLQVRCDTHTQKEHREIADAIKEILKEKFPVVAKALNY